MVVRIKELTYADTPAWLGLLRKIRSKWPVDEEGDEADDVRHLHDALDNPNHLVLGSFADALVGYASANLEVPTFGRGFFAEIEVDPDKIQNARSLVDRLVARTTETVVARGARSSEFLRVITSGRDRAVHEALVDRRFLLTGDTYVLRRPLAGPLVTLPDIPSGITLVPQSAAGDQSRQLNAHNAAFEHTPNAPLWDSADWTRYVVTKPELRPNWSFTLHSADQIVGYIHAEEWSDGVHPSLSHGWIARIGVDRRYRRCGLGTLLILSSTRAAQLDGVSSIGLEVNAHHTPHAARLYRSLGFLETENKQEFARLVG